ncbi:type II secretion system F family protein [Photobacterium lutimaris]|uniref:Pilus assembly protein TadB n=1 Tax=Photobacterium lutimaris TaxID=388278 RepID=A0A2T3J3W7_9GAMM|nr:type II secretion system F family protein [Photobacterium lutimaris]PSU35990.1 pilus assembly protein TadB [Photobacterium lutimaris]TDR79080.1 tight adherence protein B [Photobacterium lutimaris]
MEQNLQLYLIILFVAVVVISQTILISTSGTRANRSRLLKKQLEIIAESGKSHQHSLLRKSYLDKLSPTERWLENNAVGEYLGEKIELAGLNWKAYKVGICLTAAMLLSMIGTLLLTLSIKLTAAAPLIIFAGFILFLRHKSEKRLHLFEEQFVEALDVMKRALLVGYPFTEVMKTVSEEMSPPISVEFGKTFVELNYGVDLKVALANLAKRNPTVSVLAFNSAVTIQKETGGNLAETLDKISGVIRSRFRLMRKVKTLSAEGRMSAWVLMMVPFVLFIILYLSNPDYIAPLLESERGQTVLTVTAVLMTLGLFWIRKLLRIEV